MSTRIPQMHVGRGRQVGPLSVFPVWTTEPPVAGLAVGPAAQVAVAEREGTPVVSEVVVTNEGTPPTLLLEGELLQGGWQDRAVAHDIIVRAGASAVVSVVCVEAARWHGEHTHVRRWRRAPASMRASLFVDDLDERQARVWMRDSLYGQFLGTSPSMALVDHLDEITSGGGILGDPLPEAPEWRESLEVDAVVTEARSMAPLDGQRGVVIGVQGYPVVLELLPTTEALAEALPELLTGLLLDAIADHVPAVPTPGRRARRLIGRLDRVDIPATSALDAGMGTAHQLVAEHHAVRGVTLGEQWAHLSVFNPHHALLEL